MRSGDYKAWKALYTLFEEMANMHPEFQSGLEIWAYLCLKKSLDILARAEIPVTIFKKKHEQHETNNLKQMLHHLPQGSKPQIQILVDLSIPNNVALKLLSMLHVDYAQDIDVEFQVDQL